MRSFSYILSSVRSIGHTQVRLGCLKKPRLRRKLAEKKTFEMQLANCESHSPSGALVGAQAPAGNHDEGVARLSIAVAANQSEQCMFSRNTFGALDTFELALLLALLAHDCRWTGFRERFRVAA